MAEHHLIAIWTGRSFVGQDLSCGHVDCGTYDGGSYDGGSYDGVSPKVAEIVSTAWKENKITVEMLLDEVTGMKIVH